MNEFYESKFGIYNHNVLNDKRVLSGVAFHECEDINSGSLLEAAIKSYLNRNIKDTFGLDFLDFINLPIDYCEMLTDTAIAVLQDKNKQMADIEKDLTDT